MPATAIAPTVSIDDLTSLLRARKLDRTLALPGSGALADPGRWLVPTGVAELDARLGGGFPRGHISEVIGPRSSGRLAILVSAMAAATMRGEAVALIDPLDMFDPVSASAGGIEMTRMLWVRGESSGSARVSLGCEYGAWQKALDRAVKALNLVLQAGGFGLVVLDAGEGPPQAIKRLPYTTWLRLQRVMEGSDTACVLIGSEPIARSAGGVSVQMSRPTTQSPQSTNAPYISARVIRARAMETERHVCLSISAPAC